MLPIPIIGSPIPYVQLTAIAANGNEEGKPMTNVNIGASKKRRKFPSMQSQGNGGAASYHYAPYGNHFHQNAVRAEPLYWTGEVRRRPVAHRAHPYAFFEHHRVPVPAPRETDFTADPVPGPSWSKPLLRPERNIVDKLHIDCEESSHKICIRWTPVTMKSDVRYLIMAKCTAANSTSQGTDNDDGGKTWHFEQPWTQTSRELRTTPGNHYSIRIECRENNPGNTLLASATANVRASFNMNEHGALFRKAADYAGANMHEFHYLYRCKPKFYWDYIHHQGNGIMAKYLKDNNGQPANKINGEINGLFFSARLLPDGSLPYCSPFGDVRMLVPGQFLLDPEKHNFYFADFYCNYSTHYVTIVVCVRGSQTDRFCEDKLFRMNIERNPFLKIVWDNTPYQQGYRFFINRVIWAEIYYTEDIPLNWGRFDAIQATGAGTSKIGGLPNNKRCDKCNLYPLKDEKPETAAVVAKSEKEKVPEGDEISKKEACKDDDDDLDYTAILDLTVGEELENTTLSALIDLGGAGVEEHWDDLVEVICGLVDSVCEAEMQELCDEKELDAVQLSELKIQRALSTMKYYMISERKELNEEVTDLLNFADEAKRMTDTVLEEFISWCDSHGIKHDGVEIRKDKETGYGVFAKRQFRPEEKLITVPEELILSGGKVADMEKYADFADRADPQLTGFDMLILFFALEDPANSEWAPYLKMLPQDFTTPLFLGINIESRHLPLSVRHHWEDQQRSIQGSTERIQAVAPSISRERLMWAWHIVSTRCIYNENKHHPKLNNSGGDNTVVVPFADMLNHVNHSQCVFMADKFKHQYFVKANRTVNEEDEAFVTYGGHNNGKLWIEYGFRLPENMYTKVSIPTDTFFHFAKLANLDLHDNHLKALYDAGFSTSLFATDDGPSYQILTNVKLLLMDKNEVSKWNAYAPKYNDSVDEDDDEQKQLNRNMHFWLERILTEVRSGMEQKKNAAPQFLHWIWDEDIAVIDNVIEKAHAVVDEIDNGANLQDRQEDDGENNANNEEENTEEGENRENNDN